MARQSNNSGIDMGTVIIGGLALFFLYQMVSNSAFSSGLLASINPLGLNMNTFPTGTMNVGPQQTM